MTMISGLSSEYLVAPFPYFGGKRRIAREVWRYLGDVKTYIEPFFGSGAVLLNRPQPVQGLEIVNDKDGYVCNVWRSIQFSPERTAKYCIWPCNHADLVARRLVLVQKRQYLLNNLVSDPEWHDPVLAGYWIWCASNWIGAGLIPEEGNLSQTIDSESDTQSVVSESGISTQRPHLTKNCGIQSVISESGISTKRPHLTNSRSIQSAIFEERRIYVGFVFCQID